MLKKFIFSCLDIMKKGEEIYFFFTKEENPSHFFL